MFLLRRSRAYLHYNTFDFLHLHLWISFQQDIRRSVNGTLRPVLTRVSASSANGTRSSLTKNKTGSVSDSPLATSSNASSEPSINNSSHNISWSEPEDDNFGCEREPSSPASQQHLEP